MTPNVLLVDDDLSWLEDLEFLINDEVDARVSFAFDRESATLLLERQSFDLVVTDIMLRRDAKGGFGVLSVACMTQPEATVLAACSVYDRDQLQGLKEIPRHVEVFGKPLVVSELERLLALVRVVRDGT